MVPQGVTFPIDITKTRLQLQGQADFTGTKFGFGGMAMNIAKTEGVGGLYAGVTPDEGDPFRIDCTDCTGEGSLNRSSNMSAWGNDT